MPLSFARGQNLVKFKKVWLNLKNKTKKNIADEITEKNPNFLNLK